ncbi:helix-turn-helix transcriptional regulator [Gulosibacter sp. 10]|uniref:helix-turn-helix transcriptional regulator n=1 Tax=Gulosibacter sp. 10 TaxID=1255570 RepID=UPI000B34ED9B|nr:helix-turn-helix transcriptional regulator [Gulosibacter sp. 10]
MRELGTFLRRRRERLVREDFDLPPVGRSARTTGLRREEIAYRAGVSVTWYTWLEQGRDINPSRQVIDSLAVTMRLSAAEHAYVLALAGYAAVTADGPASPESLPPQLQRFLDAQDPSPAFALSANWMIVGWNRAYGALYPGVAEAEPERRNLLRLIFTDPSVRSLLPDWEVTSRQFLAEYRAETGGMLGQEQHVRLIASLTEESAEFAEAWQAHRIERFASRERRFRHPVGELVFEQHRLVPSDQPELQLVVYLAEAGSETLLAMHGLLDAPDGSSDAEG